MFFGCVFVICVWLCFLFLLCYFGCDFSLALLICYTLLLCFCYLFVDLFGLVVAVYICDFSFARVVCWLFYGVRLLVMIVLCVVNLVAWIVRVCYLFLFVWIQLEFGVWFGLFVFSWILLLV